MATPLPPTPVKLDPLFVDLYPGDYGGHPPIQALVDWEPCCGVGLKASEGTYYKPAHFRHYWPLVRAAAGERYGVTKFRQAYLFSKFDTSGYPQADSLLEQVDAAGGWGDGDLPPCIDAEPGSAGNSNRKASRQRIIDVVSEIAERLIAATGRPCVYYGIGLIRDFQIRDRMNCRYLWLANYNATLDRHEYEDLGYTVDDLIGWQYSGAPGGGKLRGYPYTCPGTGQSALDLTAMQKSVGHLAQICRERVSCPP